MAAGYRETLLVNSGSLEPSARGGWLEPNKDYLVELLSYDLRLYYTCVLDGCGA